jgi:Uma2 family endonuclease
MAVTAVERRPATWEEYEALPEQPRAEYVDGCIVTAPTPTFVHQSGSRRLANALEAALPAEYAMVEAWGWKPAKDAFIPDVLVREGVHYRLDTTLTGGAAEVSFGIARVSSGLAALVRITR